VTETAAQLVASAKAILLDFDGPVTLLMPKPRNAQAAEAARRPLMQAGVELPEYVAATTDHLAVLRFAAPLGPELLSAVEDACVKAEVAAAKTSEPTEGAHAFLNACKLAGKPVVIVSNNSADAVQAHLRRFQLHALVRGVVGRQPYRPDLMKPHPSLLGAALDVLGRPAADCVMIGDSITDVFAAAASGMPSIGFAKSPERGQELAAAQAGALIESMRELTDLGPSTPQAN
jgi:phosphoglycolate phosphatase